jgi:hypothetical protein
MVQALGRYTELRYEMNYKNLTNWYTEFRQRKMNYKNLANWYTELRQRKMNYKNWPTGIQSSGRGR